MVGQKGFWLPTARMSLPWHPGKLGHVALASIGTKYLLSGYSCDEKGSERSSCTTLWAIPCPNTWQARFALPAPATVSWALEGFQHFGKLETKLKTFLLPPALLLAAEGLWCTARCCSVCSPQEHQPFLIRPPGESH